MTSRLVILAVLLSGLGGCAAYQDVSHVTGMHMRAKQAFNAIYADAQVDKHFRAGWRAGYVDVSNGSGGKPRPFAPGKYFTPKYQNAEGEQLLANWVNGYAEGSDFALETGADQFLIIPQLDDASLPNAGHITPKKYFASDQANRIKTEEREDIAPGPIDPERLEDFEQEADADNSDAETGNAENENDGGDEVRSNGPDSENELPPEQQHRSEGVTAPSTQMFNPGNLRPRSQGMVPVETVPESRVPADPKTVDTTNTHLSIPDQIPIERISKKESVSKYLRADWNLTDQHEELRTIPDYKSKLPKSIVPTEEIGVPPSTLPGNPAKSNSSNKDAKTSIPNSQVPIVDLQSPVEPTPNKSLRNTIGPVTVPSDTLPSLPSKSSASGLLELQSSFNLRSPQRKPEKKSSTRLTPRNLDISATATQD